MKNINKFIIEKLHLNKNLVTHERELLGKVEDIIIKYLSENYWFSFYRDEYEIISKEDPDDSSLNVFLRYPKGLEDYCKKNRIKFDGIGFNIAEKIKELLKVDWYWSLNKEENLFEFSDSII